MNQSDTPDPTVRHCLTVDDPRVSPAVRGGLPERAGTIRCCLVAVCVALFAAVLAPAAVSAHDSTYTPRTVRVQEEIMKTVTERVEIMKTVTERVEVMKTVTERVEVMKTVTERVRVAPFKRWDIVPVFNYRTYQKRVAPFTKTIREQIYMRVKVEGSCRPPHGCQYKNIAVGWQPKTVPVYNYETRRVYPLVRIPPLTKRVLVDASNFKIVTRQVGTGKYETVTRQVGTGKYETITRQVGTGRFETVTRQVGTGEFETVTYTDPNPENGTHTHDPSEHRCPEGQYMKPLPRMWAYRTGNNWAFYEIGKLPGGVPTTEVVEAEWQEADSHTGCHKPVPPQLPTTKTIPWGAFVSGIKTRIKGATSTINGIKDDAKDISADVIEDGIKEVVEGIKFVEDGIKVGSGVTRAVIEAKIEEVEAKIKDIEAKIKLVKSIPWVDLSKAVGREITDVVKTAIEAQVAAGLLIVSRTAITLEAYCALPSAEREAALAVGLGVAAAVGIFFAVPSGGASLAASLLAVTTVSGIIYTLNKICAKFFSKTTTKTTVPPTTTTVPPTTTTTTTTVPPAPVVVDPDPPATFPAVDSLPAYDSSKYWFRFFRVQDTALAHSRTFPNCVPWVYWTAPRLYMLLCRR